jgi:hypothetical protein
VTVVNPEPLIELFAPIVPVVPPEPPAPTVIIMLDPTITGISEVKNPPPPPAP